jgi:proline dehydrogenase
MFREVMMGVGGNPLVSTMVKRYGALAGANRFFAGESLISALAAVKALNDQGMGGTLDHLGESITSEAAQEAFADEYLAALDQIAQQELDSGVSVKLSMLGTAERIERVVERAHALHRLVWIDMEDSSATDATLKVYGQIRRSYPESVGVVLQAALYRSKDDLFAITAAGPGFVRIVKGAYQEPLAVAFQDKADVDRNYLELVERATASGHHTAVATHDEKILSKILGYPLDKSRIEFQMLYGIKLTVLKQLTAAGYRTRVYVPYGHDWYPYYLRRLAERPANLLFFMRALTKR